MAIFSRNAFLFNAGGAALLVFLGGYTVRSYFAVETVSACSTRYPAGLQFALDDQSGSPLSPIALQGRAGFREWGLLDNAVVEKTRGQAWGASLVVTLASTNNADDAGQNGVGYVWSIPALKKAQSACLSYHVFLSADVDMKSPGHLPGLIADARSAPQDAPAAAGFAARMGWSQSGGIGVDLRELKDGQWLPSALRAPWPRNEWVRIDQEVELGPAGRPSDAVRVWVNGELDVDSAGLALRRSGDIKLAGVAGDVGYSRGRGKVAAVKLSPFVVQWR